LSLLHKFAYFIVPFPGIALRKKQLLPSNFLFKCQLQNLLLSMDNEVLSD